MKLTELIRALQTAQARGVEYVDFKALSSWGDRLVLPLEASQLLIQNDCLIIDVS